MNKIKKGSILIVGIFLCLPALIMTSCFVNSGVCYEYGATTTVSTSNIRTNARFLSDRMAYELGLSERQYSDVYEVNYDFIYNISRIMPDVLAGYSDAIDMYYTFLDYRNADIACILTHAQFLKYEARECFYRPVYTSNSRWIFRVYTVYTNRTHYYYNRPLVYLSYCGAHSRQHYSHGYYNSYSNHNSYVPIRRRENTYNQLRRSDFGERIVQRNEDVNRRNNSNQQNIRTNGGNGNVRTNGNNSDNTNNRSGITRGSNRTNTDNNSDNSQTNNRRVKVNNTTGSGNETNTNTGGSRRTNTDASTNTRTDNKTVTRSNNNTRSTGTTTTTTSSSDATTGGGRSTGTTTRNNNSGSRNSGSSSSSSSSSGGGRR